MLTRPTMIITVLHTHQVGILRGLLESAGEALQSTDGEYALYADKSNSDTVYCPIPNILAEDIERNGTEFTKRVYRSMKEQFPRETLDILIPYDKAVIKKRLIKVIDMAMDQLFQCKSMNVVMNGFDPSWSYSTTSMAFIAHTTIANHFRIITSDTHVAPTGNLIESKFVIGKREEVYNNEGN